MGRLRSPFFVGPDVEVTGTSTPDVTGTYQAAGWNNGLRYYIDSTLTYYLYNWTGDSRWKISTALDTPGANHFHGNSSIGRVMFPVGSYTGYAVAGETLENQVQITGDPTPDCNGTYNLTGVAQGFPYWQHASLTFFIHWSITGGTWAIATDQIDPLPADHWSASAFIDQYTPQGTYTGNPETAWKD